MKILYIDPIFGISGDMVISALIDAGLPVYELTSMLKKIPLSLPSIEPEKRKQGIMQGTFLRIEDSDIHLSVKEMEHIIDTLEEKERIKKDASAMLKIICNAESEVHAISKDDLHLHELSHIDTLIDLLCIARGIEYFQIDEVFCGPIPMGRGTIKTQHGIIPNPSPATVKILTGFDVLFIDESLELTTPTGATVIRHYVHERKSVPPFTIEKIGYGIGSYNTEKPDVLRIFIGKSDEPIYDEEIWVIESDIDDMDMEYVGAIADKIRQEGALDVLYFPVYMKKGRIGIRLSIIVTAYELNHIIDCIFLVTSTFGLRIKKEKRRILQREEKVVTTTYGPVRVKYGYDRSGKAIKRHIEFEDIRHIADEKNIPYSFLLQALQKEI